ncbi:transcription factor 7-like 1 [Perca flavescens]|uniref:transcription factor 7-like 1 n=1 Tax=Perca flavescens TaxID=8167 RepID=UPI00106E80E3|nr:transcription factor 7-like 1 [Perca flavescens]XP_028461813.1 transcription factor 7-like 1 [Perca flavescens]
MDVSAEIELVIEEMERGELLSTVWAAIDEILAGIPNPPPPPLVPAELELNTHPQPVEEGGYGASIPMMAYPHMFEQQNPLMAAPTMYDGLLCQGNIIQPGYLYSPAGAYSQGQYLPYLWHVADVPTAVSHPAAAPQPYLPYLWPVADVSTAVSHPAAAPQPCNIVPVVKLSEGQSLRWIGAQNGEMLYEVIAKDFAPPVCRKRKRESQQDKSHLYVKKPPNAFMLFMKEQRLNVEAELNIKGIKSSAVNKVLGQKWKSLTKEEQAKYYDKAKEERRLHAQRHPEWTPKDNYGKKKKRQRRVKASASNPEEDTQQAKKMESSSSLTEAPHTKTRMMEPRDLQTVLGMEAPQTQTVLVQLPQTQTAVTVPVCDMCHLPQVYEISPASWRDPLETASTSLASPAPLSLTQTESARSEDVGGRCYPVMEQLEPLSSPHCIASAAFL